MDNAIAFENDLQEEYRFHLVLSVAQTPVQSPLLLLIRRRQYGVGIHSRTASPLFSTWINSNTQGLFASAAIMQVRDQAGSR